MDSFLELLSTYKTKFFMHCPPLPQQRSGPGVGPQGRGEVLCGAREWNLEHLFLGTLDAVSQQTESQRQCPQATRAVHRTWLKAITP